MAILLNPSSEVYHFREEMVQIRKLLAETQALDLEDIFAISDHLVELCEKSQKIADQNPIMKKSIDALLNEGEQLFFDIETFEKKSIAIDQHSLLALQQIVQRAQMVDFTFLLLTPEEILEQIEGFVREIKELLQKKFYHQKLFARLFKVAIDKVNHLHFRMDFPITEELSEFSFQNTFARRLFLLADDLHKERKRSLCDLTSEQREVFFSFLEGNEDIEDGREYFEQSSSAKRALKILSFLQFLQKLSLTAQLFLYGDRRQAFQEFLQINRKSRLAIEQHFWRGSNRRLHYDLIVENNEMSFLMAKAIMSFISETILG